jgi:hypothetical protein
MRHKGSYILFVLPFLLLMSLSAGAKELREEAIFGLKYQKYSSDFFVYIQKDSIFIPFEEALSFFRIYYIADQQQRFEGYVNNSDSSFVIDFKTKEIKDISGEKWELNDDLWFATDLQIYVRTDLFADLFKLKLTSYFNRLSILVQSSYELPLLRTIKTEQRANSFEQEAKEEYNFPLISENTFTLINGGILDYSFGTTQSSTNQSYSFGGNLGLEVLDGEFQYNVNGRAYSDVISYDERYRWRYLIDSDWISSFSVGDIQNISYRNSSGRGYRKPTYRLRGFQITNETQKQPNVFTNYVIEDVIEPDWTVELYLSDQLYDVKKADINGYYRFEIPVTYGLTNIKVKIYGNRGEFITDEKVINIPSQLLVPGEIRYSLSAGEDEITKTRLAEGSVYVGILPWLTTSISADKAEATEGVTLVNQTAINFFNNFLLNLTATNTGIYEAGFKLPSNNVGNFDFNYTYYDRNITKTNQISSLNLTASLNRVFSLPFSLSFYGTRNQYESWNTNTLNSNLNFFIHGLNFSLRHNLSIRDENLEFGDAIQSLSANTSYSINRLPSFLSFLGRISLNASAGIKPETWEITSLTTGMQMQLWRNISFNSSYSYNPHMKSGSFRAGLSMNLPTLRSNSSADFYQGRDPVFSTDLNGSLEFDSQNLRFSFVNSMGSSNMYGKSSAAIRFYNDRNYNDNFDDGDELIPEVDFVVLGALSKKQKTGNYQILSNLIPGARYNIRVKTESFPTNSLIPEKTEFSFIAEPYSYKSIDIACHAGGVIEGAVLKQIKSGTKGQGGVRVHITNDDKSFKTSVLVFSDGSYFYDGLPLGNYTAYVDSLQLSILEVISEPAEIEFEVKPSEFGDFISNLNFMLKPKDEPVEEIKYEIK